MRNLGILLMCFCIGCSSVHSIPRPAPSGSPARVDVGPVIDESGADVSPVVAERLNHYELADAKLAQQKSASTPYVTGTVKIKGTKQHMGSAYWGVVLAYVGTIFALSGLLLFPILRGLDSDGDTAKGDRLAGTWLGIGLGFLVPGVAITIPAPNLVMKGEVDADLVIWESEKSQRLELNDKIKIRFDDR